MFKHRTAQGRQEIGKKPCAEEHQFLGTSNFERGGVDFLIMRRSSRAGVGIQGTRLVTNRWQVLACQLFSFFNLRSFERAEQWMG